MAKTPLNKRSPTAHRSLKQMREHNRSYGARPEIMKKDAEGHRARRKMVKLGKAATNDGKDVDHVKPTSKGGGHSTKNLRVTSRAKNRGHGMSPGGHKRRK